MYPISITYVANCCTGPAFQLAYMSAAETFGGGRRERSSGTTSEHTDHGSHIIPSFSGSSTRCLTACSFRQFSGDHLGLGGAYIEPSLSSQLKSLQRLGRVRQQNYCVHDAILTDRYNTRSISARSGHQQDEFTPNRPITPATTPDGR